VRRRPKTRYAHSGEVSIAYQVFGEGSIDLVCVPGLVSHLELQWELPQCARFLHRLASFARVVAFDKRGTGLSDPVTGAPGVDERLDDIEAVMDAAGIERAVLLGISEGGGLSALFAGTRPDRVSALIMYGSFPRVLRTDDYPYGLEPGLRDQALSAIGEYWGSGISLRMLAPEKVEDPAFMGWWRRFERSAASPGMAAAAMRLNFELDIRDVLPTIRVPALVMHTRNDLVSIGGARWMAEQMPDARFVEFEGSDHWPWARDPDPVCDEIEEFLTGVRRGPEPDRVLATVVFTDIVRSTQRASELGDRQWRETLERHDAVTREELDRFRGREIKMTGDGCLATFDGPARAVRFARAISDRVGQLGIELRAGLHAGECELRDHDVGGIAVHIGARVAGLAAPGEVLVSSTVKDLVVGSDIRFEERGTHELKGVPGEWRLFAAVAG
jgi:pimeloyl-ACP methyl ester carboxylesterase